ncbi:MAG: ABC transporter transmembrane domain-containing protein [Pseudobdellovibrio sp.]
MAFHGFLFSQAAELIRSKNQKGAVAEITPEDRLRVPEHLNVYTTSIDDAQIDWSSAKSLYFSLFKTCKKMLTKAVIFQIVASLFSFATPVLIHQFMELLQQPHKTQGQLIGLCFLALGFGICGAGNGITIQHYFYQTLNYFQTATNLVNKKIYKHALKLSNNAKQKYQIGDIVNFMSTDADALGDAAITTIDLINAVVLLIGCSALLFYYLGWSALAAIFVIIILVPLTQVLAKQFISLEENLMAKRDQRMTLMTQILNAIRVIKYFGWERSILKEVSSIRNQEIQSRMKLAKVEIFWGILYASISTVVLFVALYTHYLRGQPIDLPLVLTCVSIFALMEDHFGGLTRFIGRFMTIFVSGKRITDFLKAETVESVQQENLTTLDHSQNKKVISLNHVSFSYEKDKENIFKDLSFDIIEGESVAIVGGVGTGKSTLLHLLLNEIQPQQGDVKFNKTLQKAYVPQEAFIINASLKENITFGFNVKSEVLNEAIALSCLQNDIQLFPKGLETEIGERGVNLSGGQRQRVSIARAYVSQPDVIILDDPLSAVDPTTEDLLCENLIFGKWKSKTRVMATHRISHLSQFDKVLFLTDGHYYYGTFDELMKTVNEFKEFLSIEEQNQKSEIQIKNTMLSESTQAGMDSAGRVTVDEDREIGAVRKDIYLSYVKSLGGQSRFRKFFIVLLFLSVIVAVAMPMLQKAWLTQMNSQLEPFTLIIGYGIIGLLGMFVSFVDTFWWTYRGISAGRIYHDNMLKSVLNAQIRFFDSTPIGRILQRFSRDVESVDIHLQWTFENAVRSLFSVLMSFMLIVLALPLSLVFLIPVFMIYYSIQKSYRKVAREIKRLDSLARSPRYAHFKETLQGLTVLRSFKAQAWFEKEFLAKLHLSTEMFYTHYMVNRWFSSRIPLVGAAISVTTAMGIVFVTHQGWLSIGLAGLVTLYSLEFWRHLNWGVRIFSDLESRMTSVERLDFYMQLPAEKNTVEASDFVKKHPHWPSSGALEFKDVHLKYAEHLPDVLKGVSFKISSGARAGVVGRTGSGKSTLFQAVYRFVDVYRGDIFLDGLSISKVPLEILRKNLAVIPQDPTLFMGSLRSNLDRYHEKTDADVWMVLNKVGLKDFVENLPEGLNHYITENGANLSQGQRQLICLARALLMQVKVIFLDEATASVDLETDALVQKVIRTSLEGITLVTIAHRLSTLKDYDQIIELQNGRVVN